MINLKMKKKVKVKGQMEDGMNLKDHKKQTNSFFVSYYINQYYIVKFYLYLFILINILHFYIKD